MSHFRSSAIQSLATYLCLLVVVAFAVGCKPVAKGSSEKSAPSKVELIPHETELATVTLTADATKRLGIKSVAIEKKQVSRHRTFAGEAFVPSGKSISVAAPVPGIVVAAGKSFPLPGSQVTVAQPLLVLKPMLSPERDVPTPAEQFQMTGAKANLVAAIVAAQGDVQRSMSEVAGLTIARDRAKQLLDDRVGSRRTFDDADAQLNIAQAVQNAAKQREDELTQLLKSLDSVNADGRMEPASPLNITAPVNGIVRSVNVSEGQAITGGTILFEVVNLDAVWIRLPIYVDLLASIRLDAPAQLVSLDGSPLKSNSSESIVAKPIAAPPTADAISSSADLYYEIDNQQLGLRPGQRVGVDVPMRSVTEALVIPTHAILYDIYGGTWVYVQGETASDGHTKFARSRVMIEWVDGLEAIVSLGPAVGSQVVTDGAAELFGTEFGAGK